MHEQSVMNDLMDKIFELAQKSKANQITKICVQLGALSHMSVSHFKEHFLIASQGTVAEGAEIEAQEIQDIHDPNAQNIVLKSIDVA